MTDNPPQWDVPGWDWEEGDYSWLSSRSGIHMGGTSIFFIHGGRIRHQAHMPEGQYTRDELLAWFDEHAAGLDNARLCWTEDTGGGSASLWLEGTRAPRADDLARLQKARDRQKREDERAARDLQRRRPELFKDVT